MHDRCPFGFPFQAIANGLRIRQKSLRTSRKNHGFPHADGLILSKNN